MCHTRVPLVTKSVPKPMGRAVVGADGPLGGLGAVPGVLRLVSVRPDGNVVVSRVE